MKQIASLIIIVLCCIQIPVLSQTVGDYRSAATGNWTNVNVWQRYNGIGWATPTLAQGYPGQYAGTESVVVQSGHIITIGNTGISTQAMGKLTVENNAQIYLTGGSSIVTFSFNTMEMRVLTGGSIYLDSKIKIQLPTNAVLYINQNGLLGTCNNNVQIWIGTIQYAACAGAPGTIFTFAQVMDASSGGTLNAIPTSNSPVVEGGTITLFGNYSGAVGTAPTYSWSVTNPLATTLVYDVQNPIISNAVAGTYTATLTVTTYLSGMPYTNSETILVVVSNIPTVSSASLAQVVCDGFPAQINLTGLVPNTTISVSYSINAIAQTPIANIIVGSSGTVQFSTVSLSFAQHGHVLQITEITITNPGYSTKSFSNNVLLEVMQIGTWIGHQSSNWHVAENWCGGIPNENTDVYIFANALFQPMVNSSVAVCRNAFVQNGASIIINSGANLTVEQTLTNHGSIKIKSNIVGDGSLITKNSVVGSGTYSIERFLSGNTWHLVSSPISNALSGVFLDIWLRPYLEDANDFGEYIVPTTIPMPPSKGFSVWANTDDVRTFQGTVNSGIIGPINLENSGEGWNLIGNPYPCSIDWLAPNGWIKNNVANAVYVWNNSQYATYINGVGVNGGSRFIAMGQGFFVQALSSNASITIQNDAKTQTAALFKSHPIHPAQFRIAVNANSFSDETVFYEHEYAMPNFDNTYDAEKLFGITSAPQLFSQKGDAKVAIHALTDLEQIDEQLVYLKTGILGDHSLIFSYDKVQNFDFIIEDIQTEQLLFANTPYVFTVNTTESMARFIIHKVESVTTGLCSSDILTDVVNISSDFLQVLTDTEKVLSIELFSSAGSKIAESSDNILPISMLKPNLYIVKVSTKQNVRYTKFIYR